MARSTTTFHDMFLRLPPATAVLLLSAVFGRPAEGHALPHQTKTVEYHELNVGAWPPLPTEAPPSPFQVFRRQEYNTVCGYIGGDPLLPATCSGGSHCVLDYDTGFVGCCPNGKSCTTGVFTGCVDYNSEPQTEVNPYVYTCSGSDVCYRNAFAGGYSQYGCGTASDLATTVPLTASGIPSLSLTSTSVPLTRSPSSLSEPTRIGSGSFSLTLPVDTSSTTYSSASFTTSKASWSSSISKSSFTLSTQHSTSSITVTSSSTSTSPSLSSSESLSESLSETSSSPSSSSSSFDASTSTSSPSSTAAPAGGSSFDRTGAIVGGSISGAAVLIALIALAVFFCRRQNQRKGPGPTPEPAPATEYMSPMIRSHNAAFAPLPTWQEEEEPLPTPRPHYSHPRPYGGSYSSSYHSNYDGSPGIGTTTSITAGPEAAAPLRYNPVHTSDGAVGLAPSADPGPSNYRELNDFSRGYTDAVGRIHNDDDDDRAPLTVTNPDSPASSETGSPSRSGNRPLWQQNRQSSRNHMWP